MSVIKISSGYGTLTVEPCTLADVVNGSQILEDVPTEDEKIDVEGLIEN